MVNKLLGIVPVIIYFMSVLTNHNIWLLHMSTVWSTLLLWSWQSPTIFMLTIKEEEF